MIKAEGLTMHYGPVVALDAASFEVQPGEVVGLLGPNGAGKSTTMKILTTYLHPTEGTATVAGHNILEEPLEVRRKIGYLPEMVPLYMDMEVRDYLRFVGRARNLRGDKLKQRMGWVVERCGLAPMFRKPIRALSKGYKQRTGLAQALIHDPEVVILDEPTSGLDPHQILDIRRLIGTLAETKTVILSTHILQEVEAVSDRLVIVSHGRVVGDGSVDALRTKVGGMGRVSLTVKSGREAVEAELKGLDTAEEVAFEGETNGFVRFTLTSADTDGLQRAAGELINREGWTIGELSARAMNLEEIFLALTRSDAPEKAGEKSKQGTIAA